MGRFNSLIGDFVSLFGRFISLFDRLGNSPGICRYINGLRLRVGCETGFRARFTQFLPA